jgi:His-Xaa-Ser system protein HxsD
MTIEVTVDFDCSVQTLDALEAAAYRLVGTATCQIDRQGDRWICRLTLASDTRQRKLPDADSLRVQFLDLVTDENLRQRIATKTDGVRNVILALAFGSLANSQGDRS